MRLTVLAAGPRSAPFVASLVQDREVTEATVVMGSGDELTHLDLRLAPTLDALLDAVAQRRPPRGTVVQDGLEALGESSWPELADSRLADVIARSAWLARGVAPTEAVARLAAAAGVPPGVCILPATDLPVETHVVLDVPDEEQPQRAVHVRDWRERMPGPPLPSRVVVAGLDRAQPAAGVLQSVRSADAVVLAPADPVLDLGAVLGVAGLRDALRGTEAPVVVIGPEVTGATAGLEVAGVPTGPMGALRLYRDLADAWVTCADAADRPAAPPSLSVTSCQPQDVAPAALELARRVRSTGGSEPGR